jgi:hypothetical protein
MLFPIARSARVGSAYREWASQLTDAFSTMLVMLTAPDVEEVPASVRGQACVAVAGCHIGDDTQAERDLDPIRCLEPAADLFERQPYPRLQRMFDADLPAGRRYYFSGVYTDNCAEA